MDWRYNIGHLVLKTQTWQVFKFKGWNQTKKRESIERMYMLESSHPFLSAISSFQNHMLSHFPQTPLPMTKPFFHSLKPIVTFLFSSVIPWHALFHTVFDFIIHPSPNYSNEEPCFLDPSSFLVHPFCLTDRMCWHHLGPILLHWRNL